MITQLAELARRCQQRCNDRKARAEQRRWSRLGYVLPPSKWPGPDVGNPYIPQSVVRDPEPPSGHRLVHVETGQEITFYAPPPRNSGQLDPADIAEPGIRIGLVQAWPDLAADPAYVHALAGIALAAIRPELGR